MKVETFGDSEKPVALLVHSIFYQVLPVIGQFYLYL